MKFVVLVQKLISITTGGGVGMKGEWGDVNTFTGSSSEQVNLKVVHVSEKILSSLKMLKIKRLDLRVL